MDKFTAGQHSTREGKMDKGQRVQLHPATDAWMQGDKFGTVIGYGRKKYYYTLNDGTSGFVRLIRIKLDKSGRVRRFHPKNVSAID